MAEDIYLQMQKLANATQIKLQDMSNKATAKTFKYNTKEAKASRDWQTQMSNTAHQREVKDLIKAGLNPVLSANQGAQSYTTSSASGEAENPSNAVASMYASQMSGMAGVKESEISAAATRHAAATSAAAQRAAAAQAAAAQRYAADMAYRTQQLKTRADLVMSRREQITSRQNTEMATNKSLFGFLSNMFNKNGVNQKDFENNFEFKAKEIKANPSKYVLRPSRGLTFDNLNWRAKAFIQKACFRSGIPVTMYNQNLAYKALLQNDMSAAKIWNNLVEASKKREEKAVKRFYNRPGSGIW